MYLKNDIISPWFDEYSLRKPYFPNTEVQSHFSRVILDQEIIAQLVWGDFRLKRLSLNCDNK